MCTEQHENTNLPRISTDALENSMPWSQVPLSIIHTAPLVYVARFDLLDINLSGNKWFKLLRFVEAAVKNHKQVIITKGGPFSNHLIATAAMGQKLRLKTVGIVRNGFRPDESVTLRDCQALGMQLVGVSAETYNNIQQLNDCNQLNMDLTAALFVPEGGFDPLGAAGAGHMFRYLDKLSATHICVPVGTATTLAGLLQSAGDIQLVGFPVLKGLQDVHDRINQLIGSFDPNQVMVYNDYHFGGYARHTPELISFMNHLYLQYNMPTDFVYTGKMFYGIMDLIQKDSFKKTDCLIAVHTGGLQGNRTLTPGSLVF